MFWSWSSTMNPAVPLNSHETRKGYSCSHVVMGATMNVLSELFNSSGDTTRHGLMFLISSPLAGLCMTS